MESSDINQQLTKQLLLFEINYQTEEFEDKSRCILRVKTKFASKNSRMDVEQTSPRDSTVWKGSGWESKG